jgi:hypothetical protein
MLQALIAGEALPAEIAQLARLRLRHKLAELEAAPRDAWKSMTAS